MKQSEAQTKQGRHYILGQGNLITDELNHSGSTLLVKLVENEGELSEQYSAEELAPGDKVRVYRSLRGLMHVTQDVVQDVLNTTVDGHVEGFLKVHRDLLGKGFELSSVSHSELKGLHQINSVYKKGPYTVVAHQPDFFGKGTTDYVLEIEGPKGKFRVDMLKQ